VTSPVLAALRNAVAPKHTMFENWCSLKGYRPLPATPALIAAFVNDCEALGIDKIWPAVCEVSQAHVAEGLADPTAGGVVASSINDISQIGPPESWPEEMRLRFHAIPYDVQRFISAEQTRQNRIVRAAMNEAATARKEASLPKLPKNFYREAAKAENGNTPHPAA
jgi:hypothetical protein